MQIEVSILILLHVIMSTSLPTTIILNRKIFHYFSHICMTDTAREISVLNRNEKVKILRSILNDSSAIAVMPCCYDGMSAKLVESAGIS